MPAPPRAQHGSLKAAARALAAPTEAEEGLSVDADVAEETQRRRRRCAAYLASAGGTLPPAVASALLPAQEAVLGPAAAGGGKTDADGGARGTPKATAEGEAEGGAERPYAVEMFGLRKAYKASAGAGGGWQQQAGVSATPCGLP